MRVRSIKDTILSQATLAVVGSYFILVKASAQPTNKAESIPIPKAPKAPSCGDSFPGTPKWNQCWDTFQMDMQNFQHQMQHYSDRSAQIAIENGEKGAYRYNSQSSNSCSGSKCTSLSTTSINGYRIQTNGLSVSASSRDSKMQIKLLVGQYESLESSKLESNEMELKFKIQGQQKWARIRVPDGVKLTDLLVERAFDTIMITGPMKNKGRATASSTSGHSGLNQNSNFNMMMQPGFPYGSSANNMGYSQSPSHQIPPQMWLF